MVSIELYEFSPQAKQAIVDGVLQGYKEYLEVRREKKQELRVSDAYAWVKGNHIDDAVSRFNEPLGIEYKRSKAGYAWGYLQFLNQQDNILFLLKPSIKNGQKLPSTEKGEVEENYLANLAKINDDVDIEKVKNKLQDQPEESVTLFDPAPYDNQKLQKEAKAIASQYDRFFVISYTVDEGKMIAEISLLLPVFKASSYIKVDDWTTYISMSNVSIEPEELESVQGEEEIEETDVPLGDYGIIDASDVEDYDIKDALREKDNDRNDS